MKTLFAFVVSLILLSACSPKVTKNVRYAQLYQENPETIVIMYPSNKSDAPDAAEYFYTTLYTPLKEKGYKVVTCDTTIDLLSADTDIRYLKKRTDADAALFTVVKSWSKDVVAGRITVGVEYLLQSTRTNEILFSREGLVSIDSSVDMGDGIIGVALSIAATAVKTTYEEYDMACRKCNYYVLNDLPVSKTHKEYLRDQNRRAGERYVEGLAE